jgi:hypothetical protein
VSGTKAKASDLDRRVVERGQEDDRDLRTIGARIQALVDVEPFMSGIMTSRHQVGRRAAASEGRRAVAGGGSDARCRRACARRAAS